MKKIIMALLLLSLLPSCAKKECDEWHETDCKTEIREKYYGKYTGNLVSPSGSSLNSWTVLKYNDHIDRVNFVPFYGVINPDDIILRIPTQTVTSAGQSFTVWGSGFIEADRISMQYNFQAPGGPVESYSFSGIK